jgi:quinol monooxygenase YgiN
MIVVSGIIQVAPSDAAAAAEHMKTLAAETAKESGNISYAFYADLETEGTFRVFEEWESEEALGAHFGEPHMAAFMQALGALEMLGTDVQKYDGATKSKLM